MTPVHAVLSVRAWGLALCAAGALLSATVAAAADRGKLVSHNRVKAWARSLGSRRELPVPKSK